MVQDTISQLAEVQYSNASGLWNIIVLIAGLLITGGIGWWYFERTRSHQMLNAIPGIWTSLGILGTFIVIVKTLGGGIEALSADAKNLDVLVNNLVRNIIPAFKTSIIGIIGAIVTTIAIKIIYALEEEYESDEVDKIQSALDENNSLLRRILNVQESNRHNLNNMTTYLDSHITQLHELYDKVYETNKAQAQILVDEYLQGIRTILSESQSSITEQTRSLLENHTQTIKVCFAQELQSLNVLAEEGKQVIKAIPESIEDAKADAVEAVEQALVDKYNKMLEGNAAFVGKLLEKVKQLEGTLSQNVMSSYGESIKELKGQMEVLLDSIKGALSSGASSLNHTSLILNAEMSKVAATLKNSSADYAALADSLEKLLSVIETQTNQATESTKAVSLTNDKLKELIKDVDEIVSKNQQLRFELMQWKRVHKQVEINDKEGAKKCPNCHTDNPIEANFCRKCTFPFWEIQTIGSRINGDKQ